MIDASSLALPGSPASADAGVAAKATAPLAIKTKGRTVLWCAIMSVSFASAIWIFAEATAILRATESSLSAAMLQELRQWRWVAPASVLGGGLFLGLLVNLVFYLVQKSWTKHLETIRSEAAIVTDHLRIQIAEKAAAEDHLLKKRNALEAQVVALTNSNEEMREELDRRMRSERSMAVQSQSLAASKDVLQMHVQVRSQEVQKLQLQCESILNAAGEGICGIDAGGKITFANPTAARLMGSPGVRPRSS
mgnify:FL=1